MTLTVELPDDLAQHTDSGREALEQLAIEAYRTDWMTKGQAAGLLGMSRMEFDGVLKKHNVEKGAYGVEQLREDIETLEKLRAARKAVA
jgi:predicted HTH domain antitoxin